jgi:hypothetical protein
MLVKNQFHFQHNAAIVSFDAYPRHVADLVAKQLQSGTSHARVFLLHDASSEGYAAASNWARSSFAQRATLVKVGLSGAQVKSIIPRRPATAPPPHGLSPADTELLRFGQVPLSALRPEQLMTLLFNAFVKMDQPMAPAVFLGVVDFESASDAAYDFG